MIKKFLNVTAFLRLFLPLEVLNLQLKIYDEGDLQELSASTVKLHHSAYIHNFWIFKKFFFQENWTASYKHQ